MHSASVPSGLYIAPEALIGLGRHLTIMQCAASDRVRSHLHTLVHQLGHFTGIAGSDKESLMDWSYIMKGIVCVCVCHFRRYWEPLHN